MPPFVADTFGSSASLVAPGAGISIVSLLPDPVNDGVYSARIIIELSGSAEAALANLRLRVNGVNRVVLPTTPGPAPTVIEIDRLTVRALQAVDVQVIAAAAAGAVYTVTMLLTRTT